MEEQQNRCVDCGYDGPRWQFQVHHRDRDKRNNSPSNLAVLCIPCHRKEHGQNVSRKRVPGRSSDWERLDSVVRLRLSTEEKELWVDAAGGSRKLSQWIRDRLNAAVTGAVDVGDRRLGGDGQSLGVESTAVGDSVSRESPAPVTAACSKEATHGSGAAKCNECGWVPPLQREAKTDFRSGTKI